MRVLTTTEAGLQRDDPRFPAATPPMAIEPGAYAPGFQALLPALGALGAAPVAISMPKFRFPVTVVRSSEGMNPAYTGQFFAPGEAVEAGFIKPGMNRGVIAVNPNLTSHQLRTARPHEFGHARITQEVPLLERGYPRYDLAGQPVGRLAPDRDTRVLITEMLASMRGALQGRDPKHLERNMGGYLRYPGVAAAVPLKQAREFFAHDAMYHPTWVLGDLLRASKLPSKAQRAIWALPWVQRIADLEQRGEWPVVREDILRP